MGLARRQPPGGLYRQRPRPLTTETTETRDPVTSPPLPVPDRIARGQLSPKSWPQLIGEPKKPVILGFRISRMSLSRGTTRQPRRSKRGKSVEFDRDLFTVTRV